MKITETIERDCCQFADLKPYKGQVEKGSKERSRKFCVHCGQQWEWTREPGDIDYGYSRAVAVGVIYKETLMDGHNA